LGGITPFFIAPRAGTNGSSISNKFYFWNNFDEICKTDEPFQFQNSNLILEEDYSFSISDGPSILVTPGDYITEDMPTTKSIVCIENFAKNETASGAYTISDPRDEWPSARMIREKNTRSDSKLPAFKNTSLSHLNVVYVNHQILVKSSTPIRELFIYSADGQLLARRNIMNALSFSIPVSLSTAYVIVKVVYGDGKSAVKKIVIQ
jgi:hypothetical protein